MSRNLSLTALLLMLLTPFVCISTSARSLTQKAFPLYSVSIDAIDTAGYAHFRVTWADGSDVSFALFNVASSEDASSISIRAYGNTRLVIESAAGNHIIIVDPHSGAEIDDIVAPGASFSDDTRFIAYTNVVSYGNPGDSTIYLLYDLSLAPADNRMGSSSVGSDVPRSSLVSGWATYPAENRDARTYTARLADVSMNHSPRSPLVWLDSRQFAFVDYSDGTAHAVWVTVEMTSHDLQVKDEIIDPAAVLDYSSLAVGTKPASFLYVTWIELVSVGNAPALRLGLSLPASEVHVHLKEWSLDVSFSDKSLEV